MGASNDARSYKFFLLCLKLRRADGAENGVMPERMTPIPNLKHLSGAVEIKHRGSISKASEAIYLSQSALTQGIRKIEGDLGFDLFLRFHNGLRPTQEGRIYLRRVERALGHLRHVDQLYARTGAGKRAPVSRRLSSTQIRALLAVVERQSYTLAARQLGLAQPTVHRAVKQVEALCGTALLQQTSPLEPTWSARQMARRLWLLLHELEQGLQEVEESQGRMSGRVAIGSLPLARTKLVPVAVTRLLREFPEARVRIVDGPYDELLDALLHARIDVLVGALRRPTPSAEIRQTRLFTDTLSVAVRPQHPLAHRQRLSRSDLARLEWIAPREHTPAREAFVRFFRQQKLKIPPRVIECSSLVATRGMLLESDRAALLSAKQLEVDIGAGLLAMAAAKLPGTGRAIGITTRTGWNPTRIQARLLALLKAEGGDPPG